MVAGGAVDLELEAKDMGTMGLRGIFPVQADGSPTPPPPPLSFLPDRI